MIHYPEAGDHDKIDTYDKILFKELNLKLKRSWIQYLDLKFFVLVAAQNFDAVTGDNDLLLLCCCFCWMLF